MTQELSKIQLTYEQWIQLNVTGVLAGFCGAYSRQMQQAFPELRLAKGIYHCPLSRGQHQHWWLVAPDGSVVDPTKLQFQSKGSGDYEELTDEFIENNFPIGKCYNCGEEIYKDTNGGVSSVCSSECHDEYAAYLNNP